MSSVSHRRLVARSDLLTLVSPGKINSNVEVRVSIERGCFILKSVKRHRTFRKVAKMMTNAVSA